MIVPPGLLQIEPSVRGGTCRGNLDPSASSAFLEMLFFFLFKILGAREMGLVVLCPSCSSRGSRLNSQHSVVTPVPEVLMPSSGLHGY